jgi:protoporphyrinogen oxidase
MSQIYILGAGISGLGASYSLHNQGIPSIILEKDSTYGGLCGNFEINSFRFDRFVHFSFSNDEEVNRLFSLSSPDIIRHIPNPYNIYKGHWIKHPAQNNLYTLSEEEKHLIIEDFKKRPKDVDINQIHSYEEWLRVQYGNYFAEHFPMVYTTKYWMCEAKDLETGWVGNRLYQPSLEEVIQGSLTEETPVTYYAKEMRYPAEGGFKAFLNVLAGEANIKFNSEVVEIYPEKKMLRTVSGDSYQYDRLISSLPLPEVLNMLQELPEEVESAGSQLKCTCGYQISVGLQTKNIPPYLWWYVYDEDILPARVYSPSLKSPDNAPEGCSSLQLEIYCEKDKYTKEELVSGSVGKLVNLGAMKDEDILFVDVRFEKYANVLFDSNIYSARKVVRDYLSSLGIETIGRFGEWNYLWSDQSLASGLNVDK